MDVPHSFIIFINLFLSLYMLGLIIIISVSWTTTHSYQKQRKTLKRYKNKADVEENGKKLFRKQRAMLHRCNKLLVRVLISIFWHSYVKSFITVTKLHVQLCHVYNPLIMWVWSPQACLTLNISFITVHFHNHSSQSSLFYTYVTIHIRFKAFSYVFIDEFYH